MDKIQKKIKILALILLPLLLCLIPFDKANAATNVVSFGKIDYDQLTMQIYYNNNAVVYYSTDNSTWSEVDGPYDSTTKSCEMDISWVSMTSDVTLYFKGDTVKTVKTIVLPMQNSSIKVDYDKVEGTFTFENAEEASTFEWRKQSTYQWTTVEIDESSSSYHKFIKNMELLMVKGATIIIRLPQVIGTGANDVGRRPSIEKVISITGRAAAPTIKVNSSKLTIGTTAAMEYFDPVSDLWIECTTNMSLYEIAPEVLRENGSDATTIKIRKAATSTTPYSKTTYVKIPGQIAAPTIGDNSADITYYFMNSKLVLQFNHASATKIYEYAIVREDVDFDVSTVSWKTVKSTNVVSISSVSAPDGATVYVRKKGTDADSNNISNLILSSATNSINVKY